MHTSCDVVVIGAGISGLTAAYGLARRGLRVEIIEAAARAGGVIETRECAGMLYERGPNSMLDTGPAVRDLLDELGLAGLRVNASAAARQRYIVRGGLLVPLPLTPPGLVTTRLFALSSKLGLLLEPFRRRSPSGKEESVSDFVTRRLGREWLDYAVEPFVAGIYAGNPDELSVGAAFPRLHALEERYGSLVRGQLAGARERARRPDRSRHAAASFSFRRGMQSLTDALASALPTIRTGTRAAEIVRGSEAPITVTLESGGARHRLSARALVLAVQADQAAALLAPIAPDAALALEAIPYAPIVSVARAYERRSVAHPLDGFGFLVPRLEGRRILGSLFSSSMFEGRASPGMVVLTTFLGGRRDPHLVSEPDEVIERLCAAELAELVGAAGEARASMVTRWRRAIPQYTLGHLARVERAEAARAALPGLFLCASYRGGVSVSDCIASARQTAETVAQYLSGPQRAP
jgi:protoporphyrinogen/coproporphyrinogen III oxidase